MQALLDAIATATLPTDACRVFHGRGGAYPGCEAWSLDAYAPLWLLTSHAPTPDAVLARIAQALADRWQQLAPQQPLNWVYQQRDETRADNRLMAGSVPDPHLASEDGARYALHLTRGLNHGFFLDMAEGRRWVRRWAAAQPGGRVLNLFAYTGAFSVAALQAGAASVVNLDMARGALAIAQRNHQLNAVHGASFLPHDVFSSWGRIQRDGPYDLVIVDPPSYQKGSFIAEKDYPRLMRRLPQLLRAQGHALLCLNTPKLGPDFLLQHMALEAPALRFIDRVPNPAAFADVSPERSLKVMVWRHEG